MRGLTIVLAATSLMLSGCFDLTANSQFQSNGTAKVDVEFAISMQMAAPVGGFSKGKEDADLLKKCEEKSTQGAVLPSGMRWIKSTSGTRGEMLTCTAQFEIDDPVKAAQAWKPTASPTEGMLEIRDFKLERLSGQSYRIAALLEAISTKPAAAKDANPFEAMFATAMLNHYITISISAARIENTTGELSSDGRSVTWKLPVVMLLKPPPGYKQEIRADIIYDDGWLGTIGSWFSGAMRTLGFEPSPSTSPTGVQPAPKAASISAEEQKKRLFAELAGQEEQLAKAKLALAESQTASDAAARQRAEQQAQLDSIVLSKARFSYRTESYRDQPIVSFSISNNGMLPIKRIFLAATLKTPGRAVPWLEESFNYDVRGGLEPKEVQDLNLAPNSFSEWGKVPKEAVGGAILTLKLTAFEDATGKKIENKVDQETLRNTAASVQSTEASIRELESKIADLKNRISQIP